MNADPDSLTLRWKTDLESMVAEAMARAVDRGDWEIADKWADILLRRFDQETEDA